MIQAAVPSSCAQLDAHPRRILCYTLIENRSLSRQNNTPIFTLVIEIKYLWDNAVSSCHYIALSDDEQTITFNECGRAYADPFTSIFTAVALRDAMELSGRRAKSAC
jgi:hypothetical protein